MQHKLVFRGVPEATKAGNSWNICKELIDLILVDLFGMADVENERAHCSSTMREQSNSKTYCCVISALGRCKYY